MTPRTLQHLLFVSLLTVVFTAGCAEDDDGETERTPVSTTLSLSHQGDGTEISASDGAMHPAMIAPGVVVVHDGTLSLVALGPTPTLDGLEALAEDGDPATLVATLRAMPGVHAVTILQGVDGTTYESAPIGPGADATAVLDVAPGDRVIFAAMFGESNDVLIATEGAGVSFFDDEGNPIASPFSGALAYFDLGTEANEEPALGANQPARQSAAGAGDPDSGTVVRFDETGPAGFTYPALSGWLSLDVVTP